MDREPLQRLLQRDGAAADLAARREAHAAFIGGVVEVGELRRIIGTQAGGHEARDGLLA